MFYLKGVFKGQGFEDSNPHLPLAHHYPWYCTHITSAISLCLLFALSLSACCGAPSARLPDLQPGLMSTASWKSLRLKGSRCHIPEFWLSPTPMNSGHLWSHLQSCLATKSLCQGSSAMVGVIAQGTAMKMGAAEAEFAWEAAEVETVLFPIGGSKRGCVCSWGMDWG